MERLFWGRDVTRSDKIRQKPLDAIQCNRSAVSFLLPSLRACWVSTIEPRKPYAYLYRLFGSFVSARAMSCDVWQIVWYAAGKCIRNTGFHTVHKTPADSSDKNPTQMPRMTMRIRLPVCNGTFYSKSISYVFETSDSCFWPNFIRQQLRHH